MLHDFDPIYACNQVTLCNHNFLSADLDVLSQLTERNAIDAQITHDESLNVYTKAAAINSSPLKAHVFQLYLQDYDPELRDHLLSNLKDGIRIPSFQTPPESYSFYNHPSALQHKKQVSEMIATRVAKGIIAGPFGLPPPGLIVSPIAAIPKKGVSKVRIIHNLSYPLGDSVNSNIERKHCFVTYETLDDCLSIITRLGKGTLMAKADLEDAYNILSIHESDLKFLGFTWEGAFYFGTTLPMGAAISCREFEFLPTAVQWILQNKFQVKDMSHILDDFMFFGPPNSPQCKRNLNTFMILADSLGLPIKKAKTIWPTTNLELHGLTVDTETMQLRIPADKVAKAVEMIDALLPLSKVTLRQIQSIAGLLSFFTRALPGARCFIRRLFDLTRGLSKPFHRTRLIAPAKADLLMWRYVLQNFNGFTLISHVYWSLTPDWRVYSDASGEGYGAFFGSLWFSGKFPEDWSDCSIAVKEFVPVYIACQLWINYFSNANVVFYTDNMSVVSILQTHTSSDKTIMVMLRRLVTLAMFNNMVFTSRHIRGKYNVIADALSRFQWTKAKQWAPWLRSTAVSVPQDSCPWPMKRLSFT